MNRRDRRAAAKGATKGGTGVALPGTSGANDSAILFAQALRHHQAGDLREAERLYREVLARDPAHANSLNLLGLLAHQVGRNDAAAELIGKALIVDEQNPKSHYNLAVVLSVLGRLDEAIAHYERAILLRPDYADAIMNLGNVHMQQGRPDDALASYERVLALRPDIAAAHYNIANILAQRGDLEQAAGRYRQAIAIKPDLAEAHNNLGNIFKEVGRPEEATAHYRHALSLKPDYVTACDNLARNLLAAGNMGEAFDLLRRALALGPTDDTKILIVRCLQNLKATSDDPDLRSLILRAFSECWVSANEFAPVVGSFLKGADGIRNAMARVSEAWPRRLSWDEILGPSAFAGIAGDTLLCALLESAPICDIELERLMTAIRFALLQTNAGTPAPAVERGDGLRFCSALARQCFINEYVFDLTPDETEMAEGLRQKVGAAISSGAAVSPLQLAMLAAYVPLHALDGADALLGGSWPQAVDALLTQQVREPRREQAVRVSIPALTKIDDEVSVAVRRQYEENPYPRWVMAPAAGPQARLEDDLRAKLPHAPIRRLAGDHPLDILVAGCGTGRHTIETARRYANTRILCIDLSLASLAYASRKTSELGLSGIEYAQADILKLSSIGRTFDVIESNGVLHHLGDPFAGWRVLVGILRPNGLMNIGLYSAAARRDVTSARAYISEKGYGLSAEDIRICRQDLISHPEDTPLRNVTRSRDFFSTSSCRDLLFHVQEHQFTIPQIAAFLTAHDLRFLGFELDISVIQRFRRKFPEPQAVTDLDRWHDFERDDPTAFVGMYQFWAQKDG